MCYINSPVDAIFLAFKPETQRAIDGWGALMLVYATLFVPTLFVSLVGLNLLVWARSRINYVFIFGQFPKKFPGSRSFLIVRRIGNNDCTRLSRVLRGSKHASCWSGVLFLAFVFAHGRFDGLADDMAAYLVGCDGGLGVQPVSDCLP